MSETILYISYKLVKNASVEEFLQASKKLNDEYMSKQKGYISWEQLNDGDLWIDMVRFASKEDAVRVEKNSAPTAEALKFYSFINLPSCRVQYLTVEKSYK